MLASRRARVKRYRDIADIDAVNAQTNFRFQEIKNLDA
jgi:hypothetical protein